MNDQQRVRLIMLGTAGLLLAAGVAGWSWYNTQKQQQETENETAIVPHVRPIGAVTAKSGGTALQPQPGLTAKTAPVPANGQPSASQKPGVAAPAGPTVANAGAAAVPGQPTSPASAAQPATSAPPSPLVHASSQPLAVRPSVPQANLPGNAFAPHPGAEPPPAATALAHRAAAPAAAQPLAAQTPAGKGLPTAALPVQAAAASSAAPPAGPGVQPATPPEAIEEAARKEAGRNDPMAELGKMNPFPRVAALAPKQKPEKPGTVPPPPPGVPAKPGAKDSGEQTAMAPRGKKPIDMVPPPPPTAPSASGLEGLDITQLPAPPSKPMIGDKMKVLAVMDDRAVITFPLDMRSKNKWPQTITLATGEQFDSIKVVQVTPDGVTIEEDGERSLRPLPAVK